EPGLLIHKNGIAFPAHIAFIHPHIIKTTNDPVFRLPGDHKGIAVNKNRILILKGSRYCPFCNKNRIPVPKDFSIMPGYKAVVQGICYPNVIGAGSKTCVSVKI